MVRLPRIITEKVRPYKINGYECFRISYESLRISYEAYDQSAEFRVNPLTTYECLTITTNALPSIRIYCDAYENNKNMLS